jgi:hypothetical protein
MSKFPQKYLDAIGKKFGELTVVSIFRNPDNYRQIKYSCTCSCGRKRIERDARSVIRPNRNPSCGCASKSGTNSSRKDEAGRVRANTNISKALVKKGKWWDRCVFACGEVVGPDGVWFVDDPQYDPFYQRN